MKSRNLSSIQSAARLAAVLIAVLATAQAAGAALNITDARSPLERERPLRKQTRFIVLHTTEAPERSSLNKLRENGEAHYLVGTRGQVYRLLDKRKLARHAGVSMWEGFDGLDHYSIGIEVVGYHDRAITAAQYGALKNLLDELKALYKIPDARVLTHSMVAYGRPNRWHKRPHRGRKRCGMLFARDSVRKQLGLHAKPLYDPDVKAGRLAIGDAALACVLYGDSTASEKQYVSLSKARNDVISPHSTPWNIAGVNYNKKSTLYIFPNGREWRGDQITDWTTIPSGTRVVSDYNVALPSPAVPAPPPRMIPAVAPRMAVAPPPSRPSEAASPTAWSPTLASMKVLGADGKDPRELAGEGYNQRGTIYFLPDGRIRRGDEFSKEEELMALPAETVMLIGYTYGGRTSPRNSPMSICGARWNHPQTYYRFADGRLEPGNVLTDRAIPSNAMVFYP